MKAEVRSCLKRYEIRRNSFFKIIQTDRSLSDDLEQRLNQNGSFEDYNEIP